MNPITKPQNQNPWLLHVRSYQAENKCTYAVALKESKESYKKVTKEKVVKKKSTKEIEVPLEEAPIVRKKRVYKRKEKAVIETADNETPTE